MHYSSATVILLLCLLGTGNHTHAVEKPAADKDKQKTNRRFDFSYGANVKNLSADAKVRIWIPVATSNRQQQVALLDVAADVKLSLAQDAEYGNQIGYFETVADAKGEFPFKLTYHVDRQEAGLEATSTLSEQEKARFLAANRLVPTSGKPTKLLTNGLPRDSLAAGEMLYDVVERHMKYDKTKPGWGNGDSEWACDSRSGNCTDFHSLFISLARSKQMPARFEIGFPLPTDAASGPIGGYHCWAWFFAENKGWLPVDISEADKHPEMRDYFCGQLTPDRIAFSTGRDIKLVPESAADPLNFFVYPHVEVDGQVWDRKNIDLDFSFRDHTAPANSPSTDQ